MYIQRKSSDGIKISGTIIKRLDFRTEILGISDLYQLDGNGDIVFETAEGKKDKLFHGTNLKGGKEFYFGKKVELSTVSVCSDGRRYYRDIFDFGKNTEQNYCYIFKFNKRDIVGDYDSLAWVFWDDIIYDAWKKVYNLNELDVDESKLKYDKEGKMCAVYFQQNKVRLVVASTLHIDKETYFSLQDENTVILDVFLGIAIINGEKVCFDGMFKSGKSLHTMLEFNASSKASVELGVDDFDLKYNQGYVYFSPFKLESKETKNIKMEAITQGNVIFEVKNSNNNWEKIDNSLLLNSENIELRAKMKMGDKIKDIYFTENIV